ncbi:MAG: winged helix DNA-binding protein [Acholeplasmataceae bacterium]|jgi:DNA-binding MarR family transcriptional regulator|nr:winged helix DNA-binding protein [Acholeplasmataceae bacterium]
MKEYRQLQKLDRSLQTFRRSGIYKRSKTTLSDADIMVLFCVSFCDTNQKVKLSDIAKTLRVTLPAVTHKVNDLVEKEYVEKETSDKDLRITFIKLTENGKNYVESIRDAYYEPLKHLVKHLGDEDTDNLIRILDKISQIGKMN